MTANHFDYDTAFSRNIGWVTKAEQARLRTKKVAIAGMGGVGGVHLLTLARLGISHFVIADFDSFDIANFNRQVGAMMSTVGRSKAEVLGEMVKDINPEVEITIIHEAVTRKNIDIFLDGVDMYVDSLDFFAFDARTLVFGECASRGIPATTAAPLGMGTSLLNFIPGKMTFEEYFQWGDRSETEKAIRFVAGLAPAALHVKYLADVTAVNFEERRGPSTIMACQLCAGVVATEALKILLRRKDVIAAPRGVHFDAYRHKMVITWRPWGNNNPIQQVLIKIISNKLQREKQSTALKAI